MDKLFKELLVCDRDALMNFILELELSAHSEHEKLVLLYAKILSAYFQSEIRLLDKYTTKLATLVELSPTHKTLYHISLARKDIRNFSIDPLRLENLIALGETTPEWKGEIYFICGNSYSRIEKYYKSRDAYLKSYKYFNEVGLEKKGLLSLQNYVAADGMLYPEKRVVAELQMILDKAKAIRAKDIEGLVSMNLSVEYELIGAREAALSYAQSAFELLAGHKETYQYFSAACHLCRLLFEMKHFQEANNLFAIIKTSRLPEIQANIKMLEQLKMGVAEVTPPDEHLLPWWSNDFNGKCKDLKLGKLGEKLVRYLIDGSRTKKEIIHHLYGDSIEFSSLENRFQVLLSRIRKSNKELIVLQDDGKYSLKPMELDFKKKVI